MRRWLPGLAIAHALGATAAEPPAVYDVEALAQARVVVDFGSRLPDAGVPPTLTVVSAAGSHVVHLVRRTERCESLCGGIDAPTCHRAGLYRTGDGSLPTLPALAIEGAAELDVVAARFGEAGRPEEVARGFVTDDFQASPPLRGRPFLYRWQPASDGSGLRLETRFLFGTHDVLLEITPDPYDLAPCRVRRFEELVGLVCPDESFLYEGDRLVLQAGTDGYGEAALDLVARFAWKGVEHRLVVVAGKGFRTTLLLRREGDVWRVLVPPKDYPFLC